MFKNYFKTVWRNFLKNMTTSLVNVGGLSIGMTAAVFIFLWVQNEMNFDNYHKDADKIYRVTTNVKEFGLVWETSPLLLADAIKKEIPEVNETARVRDGNMPVFNIQNKLSFDTKCAYVDASWFDIFHYDFVAGDASAFATDPNSIILTASDAKKYFGKSDVVGTTIRVDSFNLVVRAIVSDAPANSSFHYTSFIPLLNFLRDASRRENDEQWQNANYHTFLTIKPSTNAAVVSKKITQLYQKKSEDNTVASTLMPLTKMHFETETGNSVFIHGNKQTVYIFTVLAIFLLLIACINYVNLTTAKAGLRSKEVSIRKIVGANRMQLFYQFVAEALLVSIVSLFFTLFLVQLCLPAFNSLTNKIFVLSGTDSSMWRVIGITLIAAFVLNSIYPALTLSSLKPLSVFKGFTVLRIKDTYFRKALVVFQFTVSIILIAGTIVIYKQMEFVRQTNPGYNKSQIITFHLPPSINQDKKEILIETIKQDLLKNSGIEHVSVANQSIVDIGSFSAGAADWDGHDSSFHPKIAQLSVDPDYAETMQLHMREGRWFQSSNQADKNNVVLNETAINELHIHAPYIGQRFAWKGIPGQIIGVVKDFKFKSLHDKTGPLVAFQKPSWYNQFVVRVSAGNISQGVKAIQNTWQKFFPGDPVDYNFLDDAFNDLYKSDQQTSRLIFVFAMIAVFISSLGLFTLAAFTAEQKAKEIGIRKVLGASVAGVTQLLTKSFLKLVGVALVIACPIAWPVMNNWLQNFAYRIDMNVWMIIVAGLVAMIIAILTISFQAVKAAMANPVKSLRSE